MPYRVKGKTVEVSRPKGWVTLKVHLAALNINVKHSDTRDM